MFFCIGFGRGGWAAGQAVRLDGMAEAAAGFVTAKGRVDSIMEKEGGCVLTLSHAAVSGHKGEGSFPKLLVYLEEDAAARCLAQGKPGMWAEVRGELEPFSPARNPGGFDYALYYRSLGVSCRIYGESFQVLDAGYSPFLEFLRRMRARGSRVLERVTDPVDAGILKAAVLGDKSGLDDEVRDLYQKNGIAHLLAISGLHLSIVGMGVFSLLRRAGLGYGGSALIGSAVIASYGILTGGSASVARAVLMLMCSFLASYLGRTYDLLSAMSLALCLLLWDSPYLLLQGGFQLSFGAICGIGLVSPCLSAWLRPEKAWQKALTASASIQLMTAPVVLYHFFQYPVYGILLNLLVIPLMTYVVCSGIGAILLGSVWLPAGVAAAGAGHYVLAFYHLLCVRVSRLPGCSWTLGRPGLRAVLGYYLTLFAGLAVIHVVLRRGREREEETEGGERCGRSRRGEEVERAGRTGRGKGVKRLEAVGKAGRWLTALALGGLCFSFLLPRPVDGLEVTFLDVGQGDGIVLRTGRRVILDDGGSNSEKSLGQYCLEPFLKSRGVSRVDFALVSHGDNDHISGLIYLLEECEDIRITNLLLPCLGEGDEACERLKRLAEGRGTAVWELTAGDRFQAEDVSFTCIYPGKNGRAGDRNEQSEVVRVDYGDFHLLLTGDMSARGEGEILDEPGISSGLEEIQVLKTAHHGSKTSSSEEFLRAVSPDWAVISYEEGNSYGHPHEEVLQRLRAQKVTIWETAKSGAIRLHTDGTHIRWEPYIKEPS